MKMKDFKAALKRKIGYAEKNLKADDDYYLGYISCMEDMLKFIEGGEEDGKYGLYEENGSTCERRL